MSQQRVSGAHQTMLRETPDSSATYFTARQIVISIYPVNNVGINDEKRLWHADDNAEVGAEFKSLHN
ncbi:MAG: hypothetical protein WCF45_14255, partial [Photobacterium halotolerans]